MAPVPCPIHSKPMASARKPMIESDLAMHSSLSPFRPLTPRGFVVWPA
jgi:hypothetical protein